MRACSEPRPAGIRATSFATRCRSAAIERRAPVVGLALDGARSTAPCVRQYPAAMGGFVAGAASQPRRRSAPAAGRPMTMRTKTKPILLLAVAVVAALALARCWTHAGDDAADPTLVFDRVWLDELPRTPKQTFNTFVAATEEPFGL